MASILAIIYVVLMSIFIVMMFLKSGKSRGNLQRIASRQFIHDMIASSTNEMQVYDCMYIVQFHLKRFGPRVSKSKIERDLRIITSCMNTRLYELNGKDANTITIDI